LPPAARLAAAASVLDSIAQGRAPAEVVLKAWGAANRYAGSGDRRAVADRVIFMDEGRIVEDAAPDPFFNHPKSERLRQFLSQILAH